MSHISQNISEEKQVNYRGFSLPKEGDMLESLFAQAPIAMATLKGSNYIIEMVNDRFLDIIGRSRQDLLGKAAFEIFPEVKEQGFPDVLDNVKKTGEAFSHFEKKADVIFSTKLKSLYLDIVYQPIREAGGSVERIVVMLTDKTEQVLNRKKLEKSEWQFRNLVMQSPVAMGILRGPDMVIELTNDALLEIWRRDIEEVQGKPLLEVFPELEEQPYPGLLKQVYETGIPYKKEESLVHIETRHGSKNYYADFMYMPLFEPDGKTVSGVIVTSNDITKQVEARQNLKESELRFRQLIDGLPVAVYTCNEHGRLRIFNDAAVALWGRTPEIDEDLWCGSLKMYYTNGDSLPLDNCPMAIAINENRMIKAEAIIERPDGSRRYVLAYPQPVRNSEGRLTGAVNVLVDITERKELEQQKDDFMSIVSHELKTPITSLKVYGQLLRKRFSDAGDKNSADMLGKMNNQINKLTTLIKDLLDASRIESGKLVFEKARFDLDELVNETIEEVQRTVNSHHIIKTEHQAMFVEGDRERTGQVLVNLLTNAIKYSPDADEVIIQTHIEDNKACCYIQDFGIGIPQHDIERIFDKFYRVTDNALHAYPGLGLGLFISAEIIKNQGGYISATSEKGKGTTFVFYLPLQDEKPTP